MVAGLLSPFPWLSTSPSPTSSSPTPKPAASSSSAMSDTKFFGSQVGDKSVINYGYTDMPWRLLAFDMYYFFAFFWALPFVVMPISPCDSGHLDELHFNFDNMFCICVHALLCVLQLGFILSLPFTLVLPVWVACTYIAGFLIINYALCLLLNGEGVEYHSSEEYSGPPLPEHAHEQWIFLNGVAVGKHWMQNNLDRLALTFKRPILGIHNRTDGILFDVIECLVQRNLSYATHDIRICYKHLKEKLYNPKLSKVVFIMHSQGGIEGGLVLDWLLQELPQDLLAKLEVYTFGCAANHFNNPHRHVASQDVAVDDPSQAVTSTTVTKLDILSDPKPNGVPHAAADGDTNGHTIDPDEPALHGRSRSRLATQENLTMSPVSTTTAPAPVPLTTARRRTGADRAIRHVEHYAHWTDFVALWGVLHFAASARRQSTLPRFIGRVFARASERGGHQLNQHYLDGMFPLARDADGRLLGCAETNDFMESEVELGDEGGVAADARAVREDLGLSWLEGGFDGGGGGGGGEAAKVAREVMVHGSESFRERLQGGLHGDGRTRVKVKELSRLWKYRNGRSPTETPPLLVKDPDGVVRGATM